MEIVPMDVNELCVQKLFSEHDDFMIEFLAEDKWCYTRYSENENIGKVWVVSIDNHSVGCIAYREKADGVAEVKRLFVRKEYRGQGIAKNLLKTVECYAKEQGCHTLFLDTRITLEPAVSIYRAFGFNIVFQQGLYIQMEKKL
ncbi:MAG: GNAT family N-acetyltransferase [Lachnospiraceae bacterium]|nr:GNAT family N-acetyltransferase [Lachnospiraceae bacterium]